MSDNKTEIRAVPTNIITGFLGAGKTSTILHLLKNKPENERWAILLNEFGEIGVDGSLLEGQQPQESGVFIREVPGGCMCCAAGVPMQVALNQLLKNATPDRLLIEPTGLGHPKEVLQVLSSSHYQEVLSLQKTLTLLDARKLSDSRYTEHDTFNQQIAIADIIVGNKVDLYADDDKSILRDYIKQNGAPNAEIVFSEHGGITLEDLEGASFNTKVEEAHSHHQHGHHDHHQHSHDHGVASTLSEEPIPECGYLKAVNEGEGFKSIGWRFSSDTVFEYSKLADFVWSSGAVRVKAVFITDKGLFGFNLDNEVLTEVGLENCDESRIEMIAEIASDTLSEEQNTLIEAQLMSCIVA